MAVPRINVGQELLNVPMGEMIKSMATSIAEAQWDLDKAAMVVTELMSGQRLMRDMDTGELINFEGDVISPLKESDGSVKRDSKGEPVYDPDNGPRTIDSRVYFGYVYEPERNTTGDIIYDVVDGDNVPRMVRVPNRVSMMELGFTPSFYQFVDTIIEVKMAIKMSTQETQTTRSRDQASSSASTNTDTNQHSYGSSWGSSGYWWRGGSYNYNRTNTHTKTKQRSVQSNVSTVDATYSQRYGYSVEGSSLLRTKLVPVPPPAILTDRINALIEAEREYLENVSGGIVGAVRNDTNTDNS
jgi:hypothetical protein